MPLAEMCQSDSVTWSEALIHVNHICKTIIWSDHRNSLSYQLPESWPVLNVLAACSPASDGWFHCRGWGPEDPLISQRVMLR